jgi:hypothetical protein
MKNATLIAAALSVALTATASPTLAKKRPIVTATVKTIQKIDTDNSRTISAGEFSTAGGADATFAKIDANANGQIGFFELLMAYVYKALAARAGN